MRGYIISNLWQF